MGSDLTIRVLLVTGADGTAAALRDALTTAGGATFDTHQVQSAAQALRALQTTQFGVTFVDLDDNAPDRLAELQLVSSTTADTALIATTARSDPGLACDALQLGAQECLARDGDDFEPDRLTRTIRNAMVRSAHDRSRPLATMIEMSSDAILTVNRDRVITRFNAAAERLHERPAAEAIGQSVRTLLPEAQHSDQAEFYDRVFDGESIEAFEFERNDKAGNRLISSVSGSPVLDAFGNVIEACIIVRDITDAVLLRERLMEQQRLLDSSQAVGHVSSWSSDRETGQIEWSAEHYRLLRRDPAQGTAPIHQMLDDVHPDDREKLLAAFGSNDKFTVEARMIRDPDDVRVLRLRGEHIPRENGRPGRSIGILQDVTEERAEQAARTLLEQQLERSFDDALVGMALLDLESRVLRVNDSLLTILGRTRGQMLNTTLQDVTHPDDKGDDIPVTDLLSSGAQKSHLREKRYIHADGRTIWAEVAVSWITHADGSPSHYLVQIQDITERREHIEQLRHLAEHDPLTGLLNRRGFNRELQNHIAWTNRYGVAGALLVLDLDHFKHQNDTYGHDAGDKLLMTLAQSLLERLRTTDLVGRLGGDEFAVLLPDASSAHADQLTRSLLEDIGEVNASAPVTASIGLVCFETLTELTAERAITCADRAMYAAKDRGRNQYVEYMPPVEDWNRTF